MKLTYEMDGPQKKKEKKNIKCKKFLFCSNNKSHFKSTSQFLYKDLCDASYPSF